MKYIIILLIIVIGFLGYEAYKPEIEYYPGGDAGDLVRYLYAGVNLKTCDYCGELTPLYKVTSHKKIICSRCYRKIRDKKFE